MNESINLNPHPVSQLVQSTEVNQPPKKNKMIRILIYVVLYFFYFFILSGITFFGEGFFKLAAFGGGSNAVFQVFFVVLAIVLLTWFFIFSFILSRVQKVPYKKALFKTFLISVIYIVVIILINTGLNLWIKQSNNQYGATIQQMENSNNITLQNVDFYLTQTEENYILFGVIRLDSKAKLNQAAFKHLHTFYLVNDQNNKIKIEQCWFDGSGEIRTQETEDMRKQLAVADGNNYKRTLYSLAAKNNQLRNNPLPPGNHTIYVAWHFRKNADCLPGYIFSLPETSKLNVYKRTGTTMSYDTPVNGEFSLFATFPITTINTTSPILGYEPIESSVSPIPLPPTSTPRFTKPLHVTPTIFQQHTTPHSYTYPNGLFTLQYPGNGDYDHTGLNQKDLKIRYPIGKYESSVLIEVIDNSSQQPLTSFISKTSTREQILVADKYNGYEYFTREDKSDLGIVFTSNNIVLRMTHTQPSTEVLSHSLEIFYDIAGSIAMTNDPSIGPYQPVPVQVNN